MTNQAGAYLWLQLNDVRGNTVYNPLDGMLFHHKAFPFFEFSETHLYAGKMGEERHCEIICKCVDQEHNTMSPSSNRIGARTLTTTPPLAKF